MTRQIKYKPEDNKFHNRGVSVMQAFETAVLLMEQAGESEENIMKYVHMIHMGWIRDGALAPEYLELCRLAQKDAMESSVTDEKISALRESAGVK